MPFTTLAKSLNKALMKSWMLMIDIHGCVEGGGGGGGGVMSLKG